MACIRKRRGRWVIDFYDQQGVRRWRTMPKGANKDLAEKELRAIEDQVERGNYLPVVKLPLFLEVAQEWLEHKKLKLRETTWEVYEGHVRNHFGDLDYLKITRITNQGGKVHHGSAGPGDEYWDFAENPGDPGANSELRRQAQIHRL